MQPAARKPCDRFLAEADLTRGELEIGRQREADPDQEWSERDQGPIGEDPLNPGTRRGHPPDQVELILDCDQQQNAGRRNSGDSDSRSLRRRIGEGAEPPRRLLADRRHQGTKDQSHQLVMHLREDRKGGQCAKGDNGERDQRNERCIAERTRCGKTAIREEAAQRIPCKSAQRREDLPQLSAARPALFFGGDHHQKLWSSLVVNKKRPAIVPSSGRP